MKKRKEKIAEAIIESQKQKIVLMVQDCERHIELVKNTKEMDIQKQILQHYQKVLNTINDNPDSYGICVRCKGDIEVDRLEIMPTAVVCKKCS